MGATEQDTTTDRTSTAAGGDIVALRLSDSPPSERDKGREDEAVVFSDADMALLDTLVGGPISAMELRCRLPGVMIEAALERVNEVALARFGDVAVIDDGATLELNEALDGLVVGGRS
jgi:hypothetical protein